MLNSLKAQRLLRNPTATLVSSRNCCKCSAVAINSFPSRRRHRRVVLRLSPVREFASLSAKTETKNNVLSPATAEPTCSQELTSSVGFPSSKAAAFQWTFTQHHLTILNLVACTVAISTTWLFCSAIPTLLAFKRAAESLEKLMDVTREELPDTMAAVRLSGMEISDLTMELSDLGQEITQGVRSSTRAVRLAEEKLRRLTNTTPPAASMQGVAVIETKTSMPVLAKNARGIKEGIVRGRSILQMLFTITRFSKVAFKYLRPRAKA